ncbi:MAG: hypothetical protein U9Q66_00295 [Patescibacteria group bacterium]|nr:hypothetical protein [Patescibacteria group bacterium]
MLFFNSFNRFNASIGVRESTLTLLNLSSTTDSFSIYSTSLTFSIPHIDN